MTNILDHIDNVLDVSVILSSDFERLEQSEHFRVTGEKRSLSLLRCR
jgi:hypothetical protein